MNSKDNIPKFDNIQDELEFYKKKYKDKARELEEMEESFNDFQSSSKELEGEMEKELDIKEKKLEELRTQYRRTKSEHDESAEKSRRVTEESAKMIHNLQDEVAKLRKSEKDLLQQKQKLEQENDSLERKERQLDASVQDLTRKHQETIEENVVLQTELEEYKAGNQESVQRMKDELRDLKLELAVVDRTKTTNSDISTKLDRLSDQISLSDNEMPMNGNSESLGSISLVDEMLCLVKDMEQKLFSSKYNSSTPVENSSNVHPEDGNTNND